MHNLAAMSLLYTWAFQSTVNMGPALHRRQPRQRPPAGAAEAQPPSRWAGPAGPPSARSDEAPRRALDGLGELDGEARSQLLASLLRQQLHPCVSQAFAVATSPPESEGRARELRALCRAAGQHASARAGGARAVGCCTT
jgi:hypothetical protein